MRTIAPLNRVELLAQVVQGTFEGVTITTADLADPGPRIVYVNPALCGMTGYEPEELLGQSPRILQGERTDRAVLHHLRARLDAGEPFQGQTWNYRKDGTEFVMRWRIDPIRDGDGTTTHFVAFQQDVTESVLETERRRAIEAALAEDHERIRLLVEHLPVVTYTVDQDGPREQVRYVTGSIQRLTGYTAEEWVGDSDLWFQVVHPEDRADAIEEWHRTIDASLPYDREYRMVRRDGGVLWVREKAAATTHEGRVHIDGILEDISERRFAQDQLAHAEAKYRALIEQLPLITYVWEVAPEPGGDTAHYTSPQVTSILGYSLEEWNIEPEGWRRLIHPDDRDRIRAAVARSEETGEPFVEEYRYLHGADGHAVWVHDESVLLRLRADGRPWLFQGVMYDITTRVEGDRALQESLARFRALAEGAPVGIYTTDDRGERTYVNGHWCEVAGIDAASAMESGWMQAVHPDDRDRVSTAWEGAVAAGAEFAADLRFLRPDGEVRWVRIRAAAVHGARNELTGFVGTVEDVTQRRVVEEQLRLIRSAVEHTGNAVVIAELGSGNEPAPLVYVNPAFTTMTGFASAEVLGRPTSIIIENEGPEFAARRSRLRRGPEEEIEVRLIRKDGSRFPAVGIVSPIQDEAGRFSHIVAVMRDVTDIKEAERGLRQSLEDLRQVDAERRVAIAQIMEVQEQELDRMAEGIEDRSLQQMAAVRMRMETLRRNLSDPAQLGSLEKLESSVDLAVGQLRGLLSELRPRALTAQDLAAAIGQYLDRLEGVDTEVRGRLSSEPDAPQRSTAFRIVQEVVATAVETGTVTSIRVELAEATQGFEVRIVDDRAPGGADAPSTIRDRAGLAGGRCTMHEETGGATTELWLPLRAPVAGETPIRPS